MRGGGDGNAHLEVSDVLDALGEDDALVGLAGGSRSGGLLAEARRRGAAVEARRGEAGAERVRTVTVTLGCVDLVEQALGQERRELGDAVVDVVAPATLDGVVRLAPLASLLGQESRAGIAEAPSKLP